MGLRWRRGGTRSRGKRRERERWNTREREREREGGREGGREGERESWVNLKMLKLRKINLEYLRNCMTASRQKKTTKA